MTVLRVLVRDALAASSDLTGVGVDEILGPSRKPDRILARRLAIRVATHFGHTLGQIGRVIGRDRTTVGCALRGGRPEHISDAAVWDHLVDACRGAAIDRALLRHARMRGTRAGRASA